MPDAFKFPDETGEHADGGAEFELRGGQVVPAGSEAPQSGQQGKPATPAKQGEEFDIEVVDDTPPEDRGRVPAKTPAADPTPDELNDYSEKVQARIKELTRARHDDRRRAEQLARENAEMQRLLRASQEQGVGMRNYIAMGQRAYIEKAKEAANAAMSAARDQLKQAYDAGDADGIVKANEAMTKAQVALSEANNYRAEPLPTKEESAYTPANGGNRAPQTPTVDGAAQDWAKSNPWFQRDGDEDMTGFAMGVHAKLERDNGPEFVGSKEYYDSIDKAVRKAFPDRLPNNGGESGDPPAAARQATVVASAQRTSGPKKIRLTKTQVELAQRLGISVQGYARQLAALEKDNG
jgi:hypothetical protein